MSNTIPLLDREIYRFSQVDRILELSRGTAKRWINGHERLGTHYEPVVRQDHTGSQVVTWGEFVETRLISEYRSAGVNIFRMRPAIEALRRRFGMQHPLATARPFIDVEGCELVRRVQDETNLDRSLWFVIRSGQMILPSMALQRFQKVAEYDAEGTVIRLNLAENVVLDPEYASGEPTIRGRRLRVFDIVEAAAAGESDASIKQMWNLTDEQYSDAVLYSKIA
ncbi:MAG: DUF433 domain-containing protein [bacterium]|nr:DUF433 domain-containing protein [bacterium]